MNKILRNLALAAVVAAPCSAMAEIAGSGTAEDPYVIATAEDLCKAHELTVSAKTIYFIQTADIDMTGITVYSPLVGFENGGYDKKLNYDGKNHVITNFEPTVPTWADAGKVNQCYGASIFGVASGKISNLGITNANCKSNHGTGIIGAYGGHSQSEALTLTNVYVTGTIDGTGKYNGGMLGCTGNEVTMENCFANVQIVSTDAQPMGGLIGRANNPITLKNCYVAGSVPESASLVAAGSGTVSLDGMVVFNTGSTTTFAEGKTVTGTATLANTDATKAAGLEEVKGWAAYSTTETIDGYPAFKYALQGSGTEADPYIIATAQDLCAMWTYTGTHNKDVFYFKQTADIDMLEVEPEDWHAALGFDGVYTDLATIHYDGDNHLIKNFAGRNTTSEVADKDKNEYYGGSLFGVFTGTIKNLGVVDADVQASSSLGIGILGGYGSYAGESKVENVFVTGKVNGGGSYCGGMFGTMASNSAYTVTFINCYVNAEIEGTAWAGAFMGRIDGSLALENCYAAGTVAKNDNSGLILGATRQGKTPSVDILNVIAFNTGAEKALGSGVPLGEGSEEVTVATEATEADLIETVQGWDGFQEKLYKGYPALEWQTADLSGIRDIAIDAVEAEGPAVYYNLQGVQVANPENGIYIVRRGNKVTKEIVK